MAFINGCLLVDAPASALNNAGTAETERTDNIVAVKSVRVRGVGDFPYVSAQAFRYWLRSTLEKHPELGWKAAPIFRETKIAYTDANPIEWWDDDLFGYMRAQGKKKDQKADREQRIADTAMTETDNDITRVSPFRVSTLISLAPVNITEDFGVMSRHEGDPVPHEHQFYRAVLKGLFSLDLAAAGTFTYKARTGYKNLDSKRIEIAKESKLEFLEAEKAYRLPKPERIQRVSALLNGLAVLCGGAKQALHYTDVTPAVFMAAVFKGGNNPLHYIVQADEKGQPAVNETAFREIVKVWRDQIISKIYLGWAAGFVDSQREKAQTIAGEMEKNGDIQFVTGHPREVINRMIQDFKQSDWLE
ncbi:MAG: type I-B CRISPR-associated protein Cas7/Cst2/DevR [Firmicutes bacterium]|nr:type I-B CRISPR-associated protein Cas7/Cst2/DevR [Bacillota bacterium]